MARSDIGEDPTEIEVCRLGGVGDMLLCTPTLRVLKANNPNLRVIFCGNRVDVLRGLPYIDGFRDLPQRPETAVWLGYDDTNLNVGSHLAQVFADRLGLTLDHIFPDCVINANLVSKFQDDWKLLPRPWIVINRRSSGWTANKEWPEEKWEDLVRTLDCSCGLIEIGLNRPGVAPISGSTYIDLVGQTTELEMVAAIAACDVHVGPISGPVHIAAAARKPSVVIYSGYEHPSRTMYHGNEYLYTTIECAPCGLREPCPYSKRCLDLISVESVQSKLLTLWTSIMKTPESRHSTAAHPVRFPVETAAARSRPAAPTLPRQRGRYR